MPTHQATAPIPSAPVDRAAIRTELEATRDAFHRLLRVVDTAEWRRRSVGSRWRLGELLAHTTQYLDTILPMGVGNARRRKNMPAMPDFLGNSMNYLMGSLAGRGQDQASLARKYDAAHQKALALLDNIGEQEWSLTTALPIGRLTIEDIFRHHSHHFAHHAAEVHQTMAGGATAIVEGSA